VAVPSHLETTQKLAVAGLQALKPTFLSGIDPRFFVIMSLSSPMRNVKQQ
jgi:hypothetical protein